MSLTIKNLTKIYDEGIVLNDFNYSFDEKGLYFIVGNSGIGKTTLLRIIAGLDKEYTGCVENGGINNTSFMFQEYRLFPILNALKNAAISDEDGSEKEASDLLMKLGFDRSDLFKKTASLSGGMKVRVAFVRAIIKQCPILLLDEPTKELDAKTVESMLEIIESESKKRLVIIVTHDEIHKRFENAHIIELNQYI